MDAWNVIDADGHAMDYPEIYSEYIEEPFRRRRPGGEWYPVEAYSRPCCSRVSRSASRA